MGIPLSLLDFDKAFEIAPVLGPFVESLGYHRYWFAEHPPQPNAEILVAMLARSTTRLRVGPGGVVLRLRNPTQSATNLEFLARAYPNRIDAGFCAGSAMPEVERALCAPAAPPITAEDFNRNVETFVAQLRLDATATAPEIWSLGTGASSGDRAAKLGLSYAYSLLHPVSIDDPAVVNLYRERFVPSRTAARPRTMLAIAGLCAATDAEAEFLLAPNREHMGRPGLIWGSVQTCTDRLTRLVERYHPDEVIMLELSEPLAAKKESCRLWADVASGVHVASRSAEEPQSNGM